MIRLLRGVAPAELDAAEQARLTAEFKATSDSVWNKTYLRNALLLSSRSKCAYCEANVAEESKYMEVEHFRCKKDFPDLVVEWTNLLPACKRCNGRKGDYNIETDGMIADPFSSTPSDHLFYRNYRLRWRDDVGRRSIDALYLNDTERLISVRLKIGESIAQSLEILRDKLEEYIAGDRTVRRRNVIVRGVEALLREAQPSSQFSALAATTLIGDPDFIWIKENLIILDLWNNLELLFLRAEAIALPE